MASTTRRLPTGQSLRDPAFKEKLQQLRQADNWTNLYYLARTYLYLALVLGGAIWFFQGRDALSLSWWWNIPVALLAVVLVGAGQHQLSGLTHEAAHHTLFRSRYLNELVSDWLCMFPLFSNTHQYRLHHLAHHQFVNDPHRDPDVSQLQASGHWLLFPLSHKAALRALLRQLWPPRLIRYTRVRASYTMFATDKNPYLRTGWTPPRLPIRVGMAYVFLLTAALVPLAYRADTFWLTVAPLAGWAAITLYYLVLPARLFNQPRIHPVYSQRFTTLMRMTFITALFTGLAWITATTGIHAFAYFIGLWIVPLFTSFAFFMVLRQLVQHGNGGRAWLTNTRVFFIHPLLSFCVFPMGQDYHLPHHLYATVPHYRLRRLHELLLDYPEYAHQAIIVEGYFLPPSRPQERPTVLDVLGPDYAPSPLQDVYIDNTVLDGEQVEERKEILREADRSQRRDEG